MSEVPKTVSHMGYEEDFKSYLRTEGNNGRGMEETSIKTYWSHIKDLSGFNLIEEDASTISARLKTDIRKEKELSVIKVYIRFLFSHHKEEGNVDENNYDDIENKAMELIGSLGALKELNQLDKGSEYDTVEEHYIEKHHLVELLRKVSPERAKFYALQYYGGMRFKEVKLITPDHFRDKDNYNVNEYGGVRIHKNRSKSKVSRTIKFRTEVPYQILKEQIDSVENSDDSPTWTDTEGRTWKNVIFSDLEQSKLNYRLGKKTTSNGQTKIYGTYGQMTGDIRTLHSLRHTRITDLVADSDMAVKEVQKRSGHEQTSTTNSYTEYDIENPKTLENFCEENDIDIMEVIEEE